MSNQYVLTSFSGFKYEPANLPASQRVAWFATMSNDVDVSVLYGFYKAFSKRRQIINRFVKDSYLNDVHIKHLLLKVISRNYIANADIFFSFNFFPEQSLKLIAQSLKLAASASECPTDQPDL